MKLIKGFLPWILYFLLVGPSQLRVDLGVIVAFVTYLIIDTQNLRRGFILSWTTLLFFLFMLISVVFMKNAWVENHTWIISNGVLAIVAFGSLIIGMPFTVQYARLKVPKEKWHSKVFINVNIILTAVWGTIFLLSALVHLIKAFYPHVDNVVYEVATTVVSLLGVLFTVWFPKWYRQKHAS